MANETNEIINAKRFGKGKTKSMELEVSKREKLGEGTMGRVHRFSVGRRGKPPIEMAGKTMDDLPHSQTVNDVLKVYSRMRKLPHASEYVLPTFRATEEGYISTDLTDGGQNLVLSWNDVTERGIEKLKEIQAVNPELIDLFLEMDLGKSWKTEFEEKAQMIANETADANIRVAGDGCFMVLYPDGEYRIVVGDMDIMQFDFQSGPKELAKENLNRVMILPGFIQGIQHKLSPAAG